MILYFIPHHHYNYNYCYCYKMLLLLLLQEGIHYNYTVATVIRIMKQLLVLS
jgi:hypothetical protein